MFSSDSAPCDFAFIPKLKKWLHEDLYDLNEKSEKNCQDTVEKTKYVKLCFFFYNFKNFVYCYVSVNGVIYLER